MERRTVISAGQGALIENYRCEDASKNTVLACLQAQEAIGYDLKIVPAPHGFIEILIDAFTFIGMMNDLLSYL